MTLQVHDGSVPIGEVLGLCPRSAMTEHFDGEEIHGRGELVVLILRTVQIGGDDEGIDKY